jgi:hypothetical protein
MEQFRDSTLARSMPSKKINPRRLLPTVPGKTGLILSSLETFTRFANDFGATWANPEERIESVLVLIVVFEFV